MNIEEAKKKLLEPKQIPLVEIIRKFKREGIENFIITRPEIVETLLTAYEKEKEKNKNAIDFINERKKIVNKDMAEGTRLQVGTFMWQVDEPLEILKGAEEE